MANGKPLSAAKLSRLLGPFGIVPRSIRMVDKTRKGYEREDFQDAFRRYLRAEVSLEIKCSANRDERR